MDTILTLAALASTNGYSGFRMCNEMVAVDTQFVQKIFSTPRCTPVAQHSPPDGVECAEIWKSHLKKNRFNTLVKLRVTLVSLSSTKFSGLCHFVEI